MAAEPVPKPVGDTFQKTNAATRHAAASTHQGLRTTAHRSLGAIREASFRRNSGEAE
jgi:hypothetical protein